MKTTLLPLIAGLMLMACSSPSGRTSVTVRDTDDSYELKAEFDPERTGEVSAYLSEQLGKDLTFAHTSLDDTLILSDQSVIYVEAEPGELQLMVDKNTNSPATLEKFRQMGKELTELINKN